MFAWAKTGQTATGHCNCGLAFPAKMGKKTTGWRFYCEVDWSVLEKGGSESDMTNPVTLWYNYMKEKYSPQLDRWPKVG
eukprot:8439807-Prorocentrum_lima.AAC.1